MRRLLRCRGNQHKKAKSCLSVPWHLLLCAAATFGGSFIIFWLGGGWTGNITLFWALPWPCMVWSSTCDPWSCCVLLGHCSSTLQKYNSAYSEIYVCIHVSTLLIFIYLGTIERVWPNVSIYVWREFSSVKVNPKNFPLENAWDLPTFTETCMLSSPSAGPHANAGVYLSLGSCSAPVGVKGKLLHREREQEGLGYRLKGKALLLLWASASAPHRSPHQNQ